MSKNILTIAKESGMEFRPYDKTFSVEVEAEFASLDGIDEVSHFRTTADGSLANHGIEFISPGPQALPILKKNIATLFDSNIFKNHYIQSTRTSVHVHINVQSLTIDELIRVLMVYYAVEPILFEVVGERRKDNLFCLPMYKAEEGLAAVKLILKEDFRALSSNFNRYKYAALNIANVGKIGTIEFRHLFGTKNTKIVWDWLDIVDRIRNSYLLWDSAEEIWDEYRENRYGFLRKVFKDLPVSIPDNYEEITDYNYSSLWGILKLPEEIKAEKRFKRKSLRFKAEKELDIFG